MIRRDSTSQWEDRIIGLFKKEPNTAFPVLQLENRLTGIKRNVLDYHLSKLLKIGILVKPKHGYYQLSPNQLTVLTPDQARAKLDDHLRNGGAARVRQGDGFDPLKPALTVVEGPALSARRDHFESILDRMKVNPAFTTSDVKFLISAVSPELRPKEDPPPG